MGMQRLAVIYRKLKYITFASSKKKTSIFNNLLSNKLGSVLIRSDGIYLRTRPARFPGDKLVLLTNTVMITLIKRETKAVVSEVHSLSFFL